MNNAPPTAYEEIGQMIAHLEEEISQRQQALTHLKAAAALFSQQASKTCPSPISLETTTNVVTAKPISSFVDDFLTTHNDSATTFTIDTVANEVGKAGIEPTPQVRRTISAVLGRRISEERVIKLQRGVFKVAVQAAQNDTGAASAPEDPQLILGKP